MVCALFSVNLDEVHKQAISQKLLSVPRPDSYRRGALT